MTIVHTADVHLRAAGDERWHALEVVLALANARGASVVTIAGDLFDASLDAQELRAQLRALFARCDARIVILPGNHDARGVRPGDYYGDNVALIADAATIVDVDDVRVVGVPYEETGAEGAVERVRAAARHLREGACNVLLYHGELMDLAPPARVFGEEGERDYMPVRLSAFAGLGFDYVLAGHVHKGFDVHRYAGGYFVYPGSPVSITRKETGPRSACVVTPGAAPEAVVLDTVHFVARRAALDPFGGEAPLEAVERALAALSPDARALLSVEGFVDLAALGMTEDLFAAAVGRIASERGAEDVEHAWRDVSEVVGNALFKRFETRLAARGLDGELRAGVRDMVIRAFTEVAHAR
ncbi:MAG: metallophosphoesterase [Candidatus Krumholzibacteria bacterium]|nr:metallophosphoesterase [Candidatus Krumholzibacteria bacterium]